MTPGRLDRNVDEQNVINEDNIELQDDSVDRENGAINSSSRRVSGDTSKNNTKSHI